MSLAAPTKYEVAMVVTIEHQRLLRYSVMSTGIEFQSTIGVQAISSCRGESEYQARPAAGNHLIYPYPYPYPMFIQA
jgi:hypothetical protein